MAFEYRLVVIDGSTGASKITITNANALFSVDEYNVTPDGNCLEATFRLLPKSVSPTVELRDVVTIETRPDNLSSFAPAYRGYVVLAGNPRSDNVETYRLIGMKQRFYETILRVTGYVDGADVATMADDVFTESSTAQGASIIGVDLAGTRDVPLLTFTLGDRFPLLETAGNALDVLASTVGRFLVPASTAYTYDGFTFTAGATVPPVTWGVRPNGELFFRRALRVVGAFAETEIDVAVSYPQLSGEDVVEAPVLVYYPGSDTSQYYSTRLIDFSGNLVNFDPVWVPIAYQPTQTATTHALVQVPNPESFLVDCTSETGFIVNFVNALTGNPATSDSGVAGNNFEYRYVTNLPGFVLSLDAEYGNNIGLFLTVGVSAFPGGLLIYQARVDLQQDTFGRRKLFFPFNMPAQWYALNNAVSTTQNYAYVFRINVVPGPSGSGGTTQIFDARPFNVNTVLDDSQASLLQQVFSRGIVQEVTNVKAFYESPLFSVIELTPETGSVIEVPVERVQYGITTAEGVTTTYHAGQAFDGQSVSERVVLEGLARRAVRGSA